MSVLHCVFFSKNILDSISVALIFLEYLRYSSQPILKAEMKIQTETPQQCLSCFDAICVFQQYVVKESNPYLSGCLARCKHLILLENSLSLQTRSSSPLKLFCLLPSQQGLP